MYVDIITYCYDLSLLNNWMVENKPEQSLHQNILGAFYKDNESWALMRVRPSEITPETEESKAGWLLSVPIEIFSQGRTGTSDCPYDKLTPEQINIMYNIKPWPLDDNGNPIASETYAPVNYVY